MVAAVIIPDVLMETVVPIPTDVSLPSLSSNLISPLSSFLIVTGLSSAPMRISSIPLILLAFGSRVIDPVPIVKMPVTLASPETTRSSVNVVPTPTCSFGVVTIPAVTSIPLLAVMNPIESTFLTSS